MTVLLSTPTYALRLAEEARENGIEILRGDKLAMLLRRALPT